MAFLPECGMAQMVEKPFLCIEKTNGEVVKLPITETSPYLWYERSANDDGQMVRWLWAYSFGEFVSIPCVEVKKMTTMFESVDAVEGVKRDEGNSPSGVYNVSGIRIGCTVDKKSLPKGVYVEKKGNKTIKYLNR
jgi:hypothetical protein